MTPLHLLLALIVTLLWGFNFIVTKQGVDVMPPVLFAGLRFLTVAVLLLPWLKPIRGQMGRLVWIALTAGALHFGLILLGFSLTSNVGSVAIAVQINIPFMVLLAVIFLGEHIGIYRITGMVIAFVGIMIVGFDPLAFEDPWAFVMVCSGACFFAVSIILMRQFKGGHPMQVQAWVAAISAPFLLAVSLLLEDDQLNYVLGADWYSWGLVAYTAIGATIIGHGGMFFLLQRYSVTYLAPIMIGPPVLGVLFGIWLNDDPITTRIVLGGLMTVGGVAIIQIREAMVARRQKLDQADNANGRLAEPSV
jgi:O-acetylserine/cysteine efflux transporter